MEQVHGQAGEGDTRGEGEGVHAEGEMAKKAGGGVGGGQEAVAGRSIDTFSGGATRLSMSELVAER